MEPLNLDVKTATNMLDMQTDHEVQHMVTSKSVTEIYKALATGEMSPDQIDSHKLSKYLTPDLKEAFKNFDFKHDISNDDFKFFQKIKIVVDLS